MKIALAQLNFLIGDFDGNTAKMIEATHHAEEQGADIICFGELAVCGYPPRDFLEFRDFIKLSGEAIKLLTQETEKIAILVGAPRINPVLAGKDLHNSAYFLYDKKVMHIADKALLPTYDIFDEYRYFEPGSAFTPVAFKGKKIALTICEDIWDVQGKDIEVSIENPLYKFNPLDEMSEDFDLILNISASPFNYTHAAERLKIVRANVKRYGVPMFYVNHSGAQTEIIFDGGSLVVSPNGNVYDEMPYFQEKLTVYDLDLVMAGQQNNERAKNKIELIHDALVLGLKDYFRKLGFSKAIIGLSGGIDSAVTTVLAAEALGAENVRVLLMPSQFSSGHSVDDARELAKNLGIQYDIITIKELYEGFMDKLAPIYGDLPFNVAEENIQARCRGLLLMAVSNKFGNILLNTTNKSEMAVGYGTLYGDLCGGLSVIGDVYKTDVFRLAKYMNRDQEIIPIHSITKPPSAELRPDQKDSDSLPEYDILDEVLYRYIEERKGPDEIIAEGFDPAVVNRALTLVNRNEFKRHQTAPVLRVSPKAFGMGRRVPIVGRYLS
jgi:NAD+ synthase (glutamine-hydrolysing)